MPIKPALQLVSPTPEMVAVKAGRKPNKHYRTHEHLTAEQVNQLVTAAKTNRYGHRDATMILVAFRHGLRASELVDLKWSQVDFSTARLHVLRNKGSNDATHPVQGDVLRALRRLKREQAPSEWVFTSERGGPFTRNSFQYMVSRTAAKAGLGKLHPHQLRHACGYELAMKQHPTRSIQDYLGHVNIQHTVHYTKLSDAAFKTFWK